MKTFFIMMLAGSLLTNAWLWQRSKANGAATSAAAARTPAGPARPAPAVVAAGEIAKALAGADVTALRAGLIAAGADAATVRAVVEGVLRRRYNEQAAATRIERIRTAWWRGGNPATVAANAPPSQTMVRGPLQTLLGRDPLDVADAELRYDFLPPEKQRLLAMIDLDYAELRASAPSTRSIGATKSDLDEQELIVRERKKDLLAALDASERAEYELRFGSVVVSNVRRFAAMEATEQEFRAIAPLIEAFDQQAKPLRAGDPNYSAARFEMEQRTMDQLVAALGYERALDYSWAVASGPYLDTVRLMRELQLPSSGAAQLLQLAAETGVKGAAIHGDGTLTADQKRAALAALQGAVRPQLDALVPPAAQAKLPAEAIAWFTALGDGRYAPHRTAASSNVWFSATPISVTIPPRTPLLPVPLPRPVVR